MKAERIVFVPVIPPSSIYPLKTQMIPKWLWCRVIINLIIILLASKPHSCIKFDLHVNKSHLDLFWLKAKITDCVLLIPISLGSWLYFTPGWLSGLDCWNKNPMNAIFLWIPTAFLEKTYFGCNQPTFHSFPIIVDQIWMNWLWQDLLLWLSSC